MGGFKDMKFIALNPEKGILSVPFSLNSLAQKEGIEFTNVQIKYNTEGLEIWRGTDHKDSNNKDIYENFILRDKLGEFYAVRWYNDGIKLQHGNTYEEIEPHQWEEYVIVGNKISDKELFERITTWI